MNGKEEARESSCRGKLMKWKSHTFERARRMKTDNHADTNAQVNIRCTRILHILLVQHLRTRYRNIYVQRQRLKANNAHAMMHLLDIHKSAYNNNYID